MFLLETRHWQCNRKNCETQFDVSKAKTRNHQPLGLNNKDAREFFQGSTGLFIYLAQ